MSDAVRDNSSLSRYELAFPGGPAGQKVDPRCSFVAAFIRRHPEFHDLVAKP
jgi:predicted GNAT family acetyltransferase